MKVVIRRRKGAKTVTCKSIPEIRRRLADNLRRYRIDQRYTQLELAKVSGVPNEPIPIVITRSADNHTPQARFPKHPWVSTNAAHRCSHE